MLLPGDGSAVRRRCMPHLSSSWRGSGGVREAVQELRCRVPGVAAALRHGRQVLQRGDGILHRDALRCERAPDCERRAPAPALAAMAVCLPAGSMPSTARFLRATFASQQ